MDAPPDTPKAIKVGTLVISFGGQIKKKGVVLKTTVTGTPEFVEISQWMSSEMNALSLGCNGPKTWISLKKLRLDSQPIASTSEYWNCAVQQNTAQGARDKSESYTSVLIHSSCFAGPYKSHLPGALVRAHQESNDEKRIVHIDPAPITQAPVVEEKTVAVVASTLACTACGSPDGIVIPPHAHPGEWAECKSCHEWSAIPPEHFSRN